MADFEISGIVSFKARVRAKNETEAKNKLARQLQLDTGYYLQKDPTALSISQYKPEKADFIVTKIDRWKCSDCNGIFVSLGNLNRHKKRFGYHKR